MVEGPSYSFSKYSPISCGNSTLLHAKLCTHILVRLPATLTSGTKQLSVFTHVASIYANLLGQKKVFTQGKILNPTRLAWCTNMAAVLLFWYTNIAVMKRVKTFRYSVSKTVFLTCHDTLQPSLHC